MGKVPRKGPQGLGSSLPCLGALPHPLGSDGGARRYSICLPSCAHAPHTHCVPLQPGHALLAQSQFSTLHNPCPPPTPAPAARAQLLEV